MLAKRNTLKFPECFIEAKQRLRMKFRGLDNAVIDDSIQHARIEYWLKGIGTLIPDENQAFGWFLNVAHRYLYKEIRRSKRNCNILAATTLSTGANPEIQFLYKELFNSVRSKLPENRKSILIEHALGYMLKEIAVKEHITLDAAKQRHVREKRLVREKAEFLFY